MMKKNSEEKHLEREESIAESIEENSAESIEEQKDEIEEKDEREEKLQQLNDKYLRLAAEFDNYRRRTLKEKQELILSASEGVVMGLLPVLDDFERAIEMLKSSKQENNAAIEGTELIYNKLLSFLNSKGVKEIESVGLKLDTDYHEAVAQIAVEEKKRKGKIVEVAQKGYTLNGKVIRFAKVVIGQ